MYPIADLTSFCRRTSGDVPPKLVGASTTVVGSKLYLYGGRLVAERRMISDIYVFDLESFKWEKVSQSSEDVIPQARYFHSADTWNNHLIVFGGMAIKSQSDNPEDLCVLNDVRLFDLSTRRWLPSPSSSGEASPSLIPKARYAHLSSVTADRLFIIGGQDLNNVWLDDIHVFDLAAKKWVNRRDYPRHCGTYRSVAVTSSMRVRYPQEENRTAQSAKLGPPGARFSTDNNPVNTENITTPDSFIHLPYSMPPTEEYPCDIFLFSNYNFTDVQRELEVLTPLPHGDFIIKDRSGEPTGTLFPPGLRFPTGAILGNHLIIAGTYLSQTYQSFSIWALDLSNMTWSRVELGSALAGSWFRSCLWPEANKFLIFGNRHGNLVEDYNRRLLSWDHVAVIDLEAFGIYQPPPLLLEIPMQELGLAALEEGVLADFEIICDDGRKVQCSRKVLEERWPWFKEQRKLFIQAATRAIEAIPSSSATVPLPDLPSGSDQEARPDPRLTPRSFNLSEPYPITLALVQYFYSMGLITLLQHAPAVLSQLLLLSSTYNLTHLQSLVKHAMHGALTFATSVGIYGVSTLCNCRSLQIRALRVVMAYSQRRPTNARSRGDRDGSNGSDRNQPPNSAHGRNGNGNGPDRPSAARPRGMSDASYVRGPADHGSMSRAVANGGALASIPSD
ncbi:galactose oxidase [Abortiporus biennis]|nr:galactose oxidase [Abortiporus biennis]